MNKYLKLAAILPLSLLGSMSAYASSLTLPEAAVPAKTLAASTPAPSGLAPSWQLQGRESLTAAKSGLNAAQAMGTLQPASPGDNDSDHDDHDEHEGHNHSSADPALQQVVSENEQLDLNTAVVFEAGHLDMGPKMIDGKWQFVARDDSVDPATWRDVDKIVVRMQENSQEQIPANADFSFTGLQAGESAWVIPQTEKKQVPWLGWSTQSPSVINEINGQVKVTMEGHQGEGQLSVFIQDGNFGAPQQLWNSKTAQAQSINLDVNTHTHMNWVFTKPGIHLVRFTLSAELKDGSKVSDTKTLRFAIGKDTDPQAALNTQWEKNEIPQSALAENDATAADKSDSSQIIIYTGLGLLVVAAAGIGYAVVVIKKNRNQKAAALRDNLSEQKDGE